MANPIPNEESIYETVRREGMTIDPLIWLLILHHIRSDLQVISLAAECSISGPRWILKVSAFVGNLLYRISFYRGNPPQDVLEAYEEILKRVGNIDNFLKKLNQATRQDEFVLKHDEDIL